MRNIVILATLAMVSCVSANQGGPFADLEHTSKAIASLGDDWANIITTKPDISEITVHDRHYRYELKGDRSVNISEKDGTIAGFVLFDGQPDQDGRCLKAFDNRKQLSERLASLMNEPDVTDASLRYQRQIDAGLNERLQIPVWHLPNARIRAWAAMNCRVSVEPIKKSER